MGVTVENQVNVFLDMLILIVNTITYKQNNEQQVIAEF